LKRCRQQTFRDIWLGKSRNAAQGLYTEAAYVRSPAAFLLDSMLWRTSAFLVAPVRRLLGRRRWTGFLGRLGWLLRLWLASDALLFCGTLPGFALRRLAALARLRFGSALVGLRLIAGTRRCGAGRLFFVSYRIH
jgi:hypothetical protein